MDDHSINSLSSLSISTGERTSRPSKSSKARQHRQDIQKFLGVDEDGINAMSHEEAAKFGAGAAVSAARDTHFLRKNMKTVMKDNGEMKGDISKILSTLRTQQTTERNEKRQLKSDNIRLRKELKQQKERADRLDDLIDKKERQNAFCSSADTDAQEISSSDVSLATAAAAAGIPIPRAPLAAISSNANAAKVDPKVEGKDDYLKHMRSVQKIRSNQYKNPLSS